MLGRGVGVAGLQSIEGVEHTLPGDAALVERLSSPIPLGGGGALPESIEAIRRDHKQSRRSVVELHGDADLAVVAHWLRDADFGRTDATKPEFCRNYGTEQSFVESTIDNNRLSLKHIERRRRSAIQQSRQIPASKFDVVTRFIHRPSSCLRILAGGSNG